jgi:hypothetical protein
LLVECCDFVTNNSWNEQYNVESCTGHSPPYMYIHIHTKICGYNEMTPIYLAYDVSLTYYDVTYITTQFKLE